MQLLADRVVELQIPESIDDNTVWRALKKKAIKQWLKKQWCIPTVGVATG